jgi:hypothetical protein
MGKINFATIMIRCRLLSRGFKVILICLIFTTHSLAYARHVNIAENTLSESISINSFILLNDIKTIEDYAQWLKTNMVYRPDPKLDIWSHPYTTLKRGYGDCEDMAFLSAAVLKHLGYKPVVLAAGRDKKAHVFTALLKDGKLHVFDNNIHYVNSHINSLQQIFDFLAEHKKFDYLLEVRVTQDNQRQMRILFSHKLPPLNSSS